MNVVRPSDGLLPASQTVALLQRISQRQGGLPQGQVVRDLLATESAPLSKTLSTVSRLQSLGILVQGEGLVRIAESEWSHSGNWFVRLRDLTAHVLATRIAEDDARHCLHARADHTGLWLDSMTFPRGGDGLLLWIAEFGVATRDRLGSRYWRLADLYAGLFLASARTANELSFERFLTSAQLHALLASQVQQGEIAEEWVLGFERRRLANHPLVNQVRRISDQHVSAGYDLVSFSGPTALGYDLFIEVKSFSGQRRFFWSENEIRKAQELEERYALYIVDFGMLSQASYEPQIIPGPYAALFLSGSSAWSISPSTYQCVADAIG